MIHTMLGAQVTDSMPEFLTAGLWTDSETGIAVPDPPSSLPLYSGGGLPQPDKWYNLQMVSVPHSSNPNVNVTWSWYRHPDEDAYDGVQANVPVEFVFHMTTSGWITLNKGLNDAQNARNYRIITTVTVDGVSDVQEHYWTNRVWS